MKIQSTVIRVQDAEGRGPYRPGMTKRWKAKEGRELPDIIGEFGPGVLRLMAAPMHYGCAFRTMEQLQAWFQPAEISRMLRLGYQIVEMDVDRIVVESRLQLVFGRHLPLKYGWRAVEPPKPSTLQEVASC